MTVFDFLSSRTFQAYANEGMALLGDGVPAADIEAAAMALGFSAGPLAMIDEKTIDWFDELLHQDLGQVSHGHSHGHEHSHKRDHDHAHGHAPGDDHAHGHDHSHDHDHDHDHAHNHNHEPVLSGAHDIAAAKRAERRQKKLRSESMPEPAVYVLEKMSHGFKRSGRAAGAGFYDYPSSAAPSLWSGLKTFERSGKTLDSAMISDRLKFAVVCAAQRGLASGAVPSRAELSGHATLPPAFDAWLDEAATPAFHEKAEALSAAFGARFTPAAVGQNGPR